MAATIPPIENVIAKALYEDWVQEAELHGDAYVPWDELPGKGNWQSRALAVRTALLRAGYVIDHQRDHRS